MKKNETEFRELSNEELIKIEGGIIGLVIAYALQIVVVSALAAGIAGSYEGAYNQVRKD
jgi:lactobin A/cerein 7B family class IIb bacteriocin